MCSKNSQVLSQTDMGIFQEVTTRTMERGISTLRGFTTLWSLNSQSNRKKMRMTHSNRSVYLTSLSSLPSDVVFFLCETCSSQHTGTFTQVTHKVVTEMERHSILVGIHPPAQQHTAVTQHYCQVSFCGTWITPDGFSSSSIKTLHNNTPCS